LIFVGACAGNFKSQAKSLAEATRDAPMDVDMNALALLELLANQSPPKEEKTARTRFRQFFCVGTFFFFCSSSHLVLCSVLSALSLELSSLRLIFLSRGAPFYCHHLGIRITHQNPHLLFFPLAFFFFFFLFFFLLKVFSPRSSSSVN
jgi:hypothetical protein